MTTRQSKVFTAEVPLRWADMDAYGHVNNVNIVRILEEARIAVMGAPPSSGETVEAAPQPVLPLFETLPVGTQALVAENHAKYRTPLAYRGIPAHVELRIAKVTAASLTVAYELFDTPGGNHCVSASTVLAFFNVETGSIVRLTKETREYLTTLIAD